MKIFSPIGEQIELSNFLDIEQKIILVRTLSEKYQDMCNEKWESNGVRQFLDGLSNYLVFHKTEEEKSSKHEDKYINSANKIKEMNTNNKKYTTFTNATKKEKEELGLNINY